MKTFKAGAPVRLVQPTIEGVIVGGKLSEVGDEVDYLVAYTMPSGEVHVRHFSGEQLEELEGAAAKQVMDQHVKHLAALEEARLLDKKNAARHELEVKA